jgi:hypothetical protein
MRPMLLSGAIAAALLAPAITQAQTPNAAHAAALQRDNAARANEKAAYASKDPKRLAAARAEANRANLALWQVDHPNQRAAKQDDALVARDRAEERAAYASKDPRRIKAARDRAGKAENADWYAHHQPT